MNPAERPGRSARWLRRAALLLLGLFGVAVSLHYGRRGYMPLDQSIVFDGGWRILSGQVPFRDYHAPNGFVPAVMQAAWFAVFGVNWFAYCLHAAVLNGLFAVLVARLLVRLGLNLPAAVVYGALSALVFVPPMGVPYMDQYAFFFSFLGIALAVCARGAEGASPRWFVVPPVLALAALSKQIPSIFAVPIVLACVPWTRPRIAGRAVAYLAAGSALACAFVAAVVFLYGMDLGRLHTYFVRLPSAEGEYRTSFAPTLPAVFERMRYDGRRVGLWSIQVVHLAFALSLLAGFVVWWRGRGAGRAEARVRCVRMLGRPLLAWGLLLVCLGFVLLTSNQLELGFPLVFAALGLVHAALDAERRRLGPATGRWLAVAGIGLVAVGLRDGIRFDRDVDRTRSVNDMQFSEAAADTAAPDLAPGLEFMRWQIPPVLHYGPAQFRDLVEFLRRARGNFLLISDASIVYGLCGKPSIAPSLWFHRGLLVPLPEDPAFESYQDELMARVDSLAVRFVVLEAEHTWMHYTLASFPKLEAYVAAKRCGSAHFGPFEVIDLGAP